MIIDQNCYPFTGFIPTCSAGSQNTTSLSAVAHMLYLGFHSTTLARPLHGSEHMAPSTFVSTSTCPCVSHTIASPSPPLPPIRYRPSALKHTSPWPNRPGCPGGARKPVGCWVVRGQCARREPSNASNRRWPCGALEARRSDLPSFENSSLVQSGLGWAFC